MPFQIRAGDYRHRISLVRVQELKDAHGGFVAQSEIVAARVAAYVEPLGGRELIRAQQIDPRSKYQVTLRYSRALGTVTPRDHVLYHAPTGDRQLPILSVQDVEEYHHELQLLCAEAA